MARWVDTLERYGRISRGFHWLMAALFAWQFAGALLYVGIGDTALTRFVGAATSPWASPCSSSCCCVAPGGWRTCVGDRRIRAGPGGRRWRAMR